MMMEMHLAVVVQTKTGGSEERVQNRMTQHRPEELREGRRTIGNLRRRLHRRLHHGRLHRRREELSPLRTGKKNVPSIHVPMQNGRHREHCCLVAYGHDKLRGNPEEFQILSGIQQQQDRTEVWHVCENRRK